jgi:CRISP-associated protein Cas1
MKKAYYLFNPGILSRKDNTLKFTPVNEEGEEGPARYIPVETVNEIFIFGSLQANSNMYNFLGKNSINVHFFDYYEHYTGSFMAKDYLLSGKMIIHQVKHYSSNAKRLVIAQKFIEGASHNILKNLQYYNKREKDTSIQIDKIKVLQESIVNTTEIAELMGIEGNIRMQYYKAFDIIINDFNMGERTKQPPTNEVNTLISFLNMICYTSCLDAIYHTQLNPTISYLHQPGVRRYSLALDLAEIFKPILVDRLIFSLFNKKQIQQNDFDKKLHYCTIKDGAKKVIMKAWEEKLQETFKHKALGRNVSYKHLIKLECYKLTKHLLDMETYMPFKIQW